MQSIFSSLHQHLGQIVEDLEDGDDGEAHAEAQDAAAVGHEPDDGDPLVPDDLGDDGRLDVDVHLGQVLARVDVDGVEEAVLDRGLQSKKQFHFNIVHDSEGNSRGNWVSYEGGGPTCDVRFL